MKKYEVLLSNTENIKRIVEADNEDDAEKKASSNNPNDIIDEIELSESSWTVDVISEICPHCEIPLEIKMIDIDGTNLEEHFICPKCGYGSPALR